MAGLLDIALGNWTDDPNQNAAIRQGLLAGAFGALAGRGNRMQAIGQGGLTGLMGYANTLNAQDRRAASAQEMQRRDLEMQELRERLAQQEAARNRPPAPIKIGAGDVLVDPTTYQPLVTNPKPGDQSSLGQLLSEYTSLSPNDPRKKVYEQAIQKASTHSPAVNVSYGQPVAGVDAAGNPVFFQPAKGGGAPAIVPGVKPAPQNRDTKLPAELQRMQIAGDTMEQLLGDYESLLKKHNPRDPMTQLNPTVRADVQAVKRNLELQFKELQALGALAGPDVEIMRQALADPFSGAGAYYGREGLLAQTRRARELVRQRKEAVLRSQGQSAQQQPANDDPLGIRGR